MLRQRYRNEALYPYNGPAPVKLRSSFGRRKQVTRPIPDKPVQMRLSQALGGKYHLEQFTLDMLSMSPL
jgi:hypothetical protein